MKRRSWWAALFFPAVAAQSLPTISGTAGRKLANNECPVCWTMAPPYIRSVEGLTGCGPAECTPNGSCFAVCRPWTINDLPKSQQVRCKHCNVAFWQDAVEEKK